MAGLLLTAVTIAGLFTRQESTLVLLLLGVVVVLWISELVPLHYTSLGIPIVLTISQAVPATDALTPFVHPIILLFFAGFLMAEAMKRAGLDKLVATQLIARAGKTPKTLFAALLGVAAFLSMWMSNTAAITVLLPVALAVANAADSPSYRKAVILGLAYAGTIGGVGSAIGTPANPLAGEFINELTGRQIGFVEWFLFGLPFVAIFLPLMGAYLWRISKVTVDAEKFTQASAAAQTQIGEIQSLTRPQKEVLAIFFLVIAGWVSQPIHGAATGHVALAGALLLFLRTHIQWRDLTIISWPTLLTFGGGLSLGMAMSASGAANLLVDQLDTLGGWPTPLALTAMAMAALLLTTIASNTAAAAMLIPLAIPLAALVGVDPVLLVLVVAMATSIDFALVVGTPPTMLAYQTGFFTSREILRKGSFLDALGIFLLLVAVVPLWLLFGLV
ncbi:MAG: SLC13/DASS family transporter [Actinobacteria bacterium]|jgi:sodium-dependent dicarboxylate transporter 2/3/5|nr:SLC13/DASS family transporter [Actinomycetota bacterium]MBT3746350.1 SLC13/DASS family transporter [Actinomycetota bacterium]MBT4010223.1 SLC13/DASS family transporter [Actinomycetota bacterium]MBT4477335.1 SLC13/DASS family transporter [Actinomycetota bacterium]MBT4655433.1 SLC13/DASS family transporter [Actinomycetota bacterium]